jgi:hypothetical protein
MVRIGSALKKPVDHRQLPSLRRPTQRSRADVVIAGMEIRAVIEELRSTL